jgi:hypothetical protein
MKHMGTIFELIITVLQICCNHCEVMIKPGKVMVVFCILAGFGFAPISQSPSYAEDFTFTVPVELKNIPQEFTRVSVQCLVFNKERSSQIGGYAYNSNIIAGNYIDTVVMKFNAHPGKDPNQADNWECFIGIRVQNAAQYDPPSQFAAHGHLIINTKLPFKENVKGTFKVRKGMILKP